MKKVWNDATLVELDITATAGGPKQNFKEDSDYYFNKELNRWERAYGEEDKLS